MFQSMYNIVTVNIVDVFNYVGCDTLRSTLSILPEVRSRTLQEERQP